MNTKNIFEIENLFYQTTNKSRLEKLISHYEIIKKIQKVEGDIVEFGVFKGNSLIRLAHFRDIFKLKKKIFAFDTFDNFPFSRISSNQYDKNFPKIFQKEAGKPFSDKKLIKIFKEKKIKNIELIKGNIQDTLQPFLKKNRKFSLVHIDLDLFEITYFVLEKILPFINDKGVIILDDYNIHPGIKKASEKFFKKQKIQRLIGKNPHFVIKD